MKETDNRITFAAEDMLESVLISQERQVRYFSIRILRSHQFRQLFIMFVFQINQALCLFHFEFFIHYEGVSTLFNSHISRHRGCRWSDVLGQGAKNFVIVSPLDVEI